MAASRHGSLVALLLAMGVVPVAGAATFTVNTAADGVDANLADGICQTASGQCSLRAAIQQANASAGADVITLPAAVYNLTIGAQGEDEAAEGDLDITSQIVINGASAGTTIIDGMKNDRVFQVHRGGSATINALTIRNGRANVDGMGGGLSNRGGVVTLNDCNVYRNFGSAYGGGLDNNSFSGVADGNNSMAMMTVNRCSISENIVMGNGGGISNNSGVLIVNDTTIRDNRGGQFADSVQGGGIYNVASSLNMGGAEIPRLEVNRSLITGHSVMNDGGGIYHLFGVMTITNSTISDNEAKRNGGGIYIANPYSTAFPSANRITHTTIANNRAYANDSSPPPHNYGLGGGGIFNGSPSNPNGTVKTYIENSMIVANGFGKNCYNIGQLARQGNFISDDSCINSGEAPSGATYTPAQIGLGELKYNGGPTLTHALLTGSLAIGAAADGLCTSVDQRGYARPASDCDAGAYEAGGIAPAVQVQAPPPPPGGISTDGLNKLPLAFPMPYNAVAGQALHGVLNGVDGDGDPLTYEIVTPPAKGKIGLENPVAVQNNSIPGSFTYVADSSASGSDSFTYRACDAVGCSEPALISIVISNEPAVSEIGIELAPGAGTASPIRVLTGPALDVFAPTADYTYPLDAFFFEVTLNSGVSGGSVEVVLQLPMTAVIPAGAVIRKLDRTGVWRTLSEDPSPLESTGKIDRTAKTITLLLRDNDRFDTDLRDGFISDPVALAVPAAAVAVDDSESGGSSSSSLSWGGGGSLNLLALAGLLLAVVVRRRLH